MEYVIVGHQNPDVDSIFSGVLLERILKRVMKNTVECRYVIPDKEIDSITARIVKRLGIDPTIYQGRGIDNDSMVYLVDHYDGKGLGQYYDKHINNVVAIYDHHPVSSDFVFVKRPGIYLNQRSCSTTMVLAQEFDSYLTREDFILVLVGALVDTVCFHSTKTNTEEVAYLRKKCVDFGINIDDYYELGLCLNDLSDLGHDSMNGLKECEIHGKKIQSSYIQVTDISKKQDEIQKILAILKKHVGEEGLDLFNFIVYDMDTFRTIVYEIYPERIETIKWDEYASRGSTIFPYLDKKLAMVGN